jgi:hypothetical protein
MENQPKQSTSTEEKEIDLGVFFNMLSRMAHSVFSGIGSFFKWLLEGLILFLLLIKKRILLVIVGLLLSLVPGLFSYLTKGGQYFSTMTVKANFGSTHDLYNKIDYFNSLIKMGDSKTLADIFHLPEAQADKLIRFEIDAVDDDLQASALYRKSFYDQVRNIDFPGIETGGYRDTSLVHLMKFDDFKRSLTEYDFPLQKVSLYSLAPAVFTHVSAGLVEAVAGNRLLLARKLAEDSILREQTDLIRGSLSSADTLMKAFNKKIASAPEKPEGSALSISAQPTQSPEIELFDKERDLRRSLSNTRQNLATQQDILEVLTDFNAIGQPISPFKESFLQYSLWCLLGTIVLLLLFEGYLKLVVIEKQRRNAKGI